MAGRNISPMSGPGYTAAKHGVVAMSHTINMEECVNGIRSTRLLPGRGERRPILKKRPNPVSAGGAGEDAAAARMRRPDPLHRLPAAACDDERGLDHADATTAATSRRSAEAVAAVAAWGSGGALYSFTAPVSEDT